MIAIAKWSAFAAVLFVVCDLLGMWLRDRRKSFADVARENYFHLALAAMFGIFMGALLAPQSP